MKTTAFATLFAVALTQMTDTDPHGESPYTVQDELEDVLHQFWDITQNVLYWKLDSADVEFQAYGFNPTVGPIDAETGLAQTSAEVDAELNQSIIDEYEAVIR